MIVPRERLLLWAALLLPFTLLAALGTMGKFIAGSYTVVLALVAVYDARQARVGLHGISVGLPGVTRLSLKREGNFPIQINNEEKKGKVIRLGLPFPPEIQPSRDILDLSLPEGAVASRFDLECVAGVRGNYRVNRCYLETPSPLGFWNFRKAFPAECEIRVYPNLMRERKHLAALFLNRGNFGIHARRMVGQGREFEKLRDYIHGDSFEQIHWKATAKRGTPVTKVFQVERTQEVYVILDASRLSAKKVGEETALERFMTAALVLGLVAERQGDLFGYLSFTDCVEAFVRAKNGKVHYNACRDALYTLHPKVVTPDIEEICSFIRLRLRRRALLFFLTDLSDPVLAGSFLRGVQLICRQHLVLVGMLCQKSGAPLFEGPLVETTDEIYQRLGGHLRWRQTRQLGESLRHKGVKMLELDDEHLGPHLVSEYLSVKQRQAL